MPPPPSLPSFLPSPIASPLLAMLPRLIAGLRYCHSTPLARGQRAQGCCGEQVSSVGSCYGDGHMGWVTVGWGDGGWDRAWGGDIVTRMASEMHQSEYRRKHYATVRQQHCQFIHLSQSQSSTANSIYLSIYLLYTFIR